MLEAPRRVSLAAGITAAGLGVGALSLVAQRYLGNGWSQVGNSGAVWLLAAFVVGALMGSDGWAAAAGLGHWRGPWSATT